MVSQTIGSSGGPTNNSGSINSKQIGLGSSLSSIDKIMSAGSSQNTNEPYDFYINGDGFSVLKFKEKFFIQEQEISTLIQREA